MIANLDIDNSTLLRFLPNTFVNVEGEPSLFDKVEPFLSTAQQWFAAVFTDDVSDDNIRRMAVEVVALEALLRALPSLDLVLTPNGFGVVSNSNVAPASADRVRSLTQSIVERHAHAIDILVGALFRWNGWRNSEQLRWFTATLFPSPAFFHGSDRKSVSWQQFLSMREDMIPVEERIAQEFLCPELMQRLRETPFDRFSAKIRAVAVLMASAVSTKEMTDARILLTDAVNYIRQNPSMFPEWHSSATAKLFSPPVFVNSKNSGGYFF